MKHASIIIPARDRKDWLISLLESMAASKTGRTREVIVVDDASSDGTRDAVERRFPEVRVLSLDQGVGPARARNLGAREAQSDLLLFLDADGAVAPGWLEAMVAADTDETVLLGQVVDFDGGRVQSVPRRATFIGKSLRCRPARANTGPSCNLGVPTACFDALGGFDEDLPYYFEDSDFCIRARRAGYSFRFVPDAVYRHRGTERKTGDAIRMQEHNSTYAMLKLYKGNVLYSTAFTLANFAWLVLRLVAWVLQGRLQDAGRLLRGWSSAYARHFQSRC